MLRYTILLCIFCLLQSAYGQSAFLSGYVINLNGDTTYLQIKDRSLGKKSFIKVRENGRTRELPLEQLRYFQIFGYELYKVDSANVYHVLLQGDISLYTYDGSFWLEKDNQKVRLKTTIRSMEVGGLTRDVEVPVWRNAMGKLMGSCTQIDEEDKLHKRDLIKILETYHQCTNQRYKVIQQVKLPLIAQIQAGVELTQSIVNVNKRDTEANPVLPLSSPDGLNFFLAEKYYSSDLFYNLNLSLFFEKKRQFAIETGVNFGNADFSATAISTINEDLYHSILSYNSVSIPVSLRYENQMGKFNVFAGGGLVYSFVSNRETEAFIDKDTNFGRIVSRPENPITLDSKLLGFLFQAGIKYHFKDFYSGFNGKYYSQAGVNELNTIEAIYVRQSLEFFFGYTLNLSK